MGENKNIKCVEDLEVYKKAHNLALRLYKITQHFPSEEKFGLVSQIRRAASSIDVQVNSIGVSIDVYSITHTHTYTIRLMGCN